MTINFSKDSYHNSVIFQCCSPYYRVDAKEFSEFQRLNCPSCNTPLTTAPEEQEKITKIQSQLKKIFCKQNELPETKERALLKEFSVQSLLQEINESVDRFPFRKISGLEFLKDEPLNTATFGKFAYALPGEGTSSIIEEFLLEHNQSKMDTQIIEYGAGSALWSRFFLENGFKSVAIDCKKTKPLYIPKKKCYLKKPEHKILYVGQNECGLPKDCSNQLLFLCWPENPSCNLYPMYAGRILKEFRERNGVISIYIGMPKGGNTAGPSFFDEVAEHWIIKRASPEENAFQSNSPNPEDAFYFLKKRMISASTKKTIYRIAVTIWAIGIGILIIKALTSTRKKLS